MVCILLSEMMDKERVGKRIITRELGFSVIEELRFKK
jgi:hypothetical protein